ncbi:homoserine kinase [Candidatus Bathyarchaeota archaeon]|nr:homoserine kinase [Candidatus Bathyarchaeota archaeon]
MKQCHFNRVIVKVPATSANLGPGFDVFGLALEKPNDTVELCLAEKDIKIEIVGLGAERIPLELERNTAGVVAQEIVRRFSLNTGLSIKIEKGILPGSGLGSSAASAAAVSYGLNQMFGLELGKEQLAAIAAKGEFVSAGSPHADNVSAAIFGDFVIVRSFKPLKIVNLKTPLEMGVCVAIPNIAVQNGKTQKARSVVPKQVSMKKLTSNLGNAAALVAGFALGDVDLIGESIKDLIVEPKRALLIPGYQKVKENAINAGASGVAISGAGPAMIAIVNKQKANIIDVARSMQNAFKSVDVTATALVTRPGKGISLMELK